MAEKEPEDYNHEMILFSPVLLNEYGFDEGEGYFDGYNAICEECGVVLRHYVPQEVVGLVKRDFIVNRSLASDPEGSAPEEE